MKDKISAQEFYDRKKALLRSGLSDKDFNRRLAELIKLRPSETQGIFVSNPSCGGRKPVELLTDRAKRYRANSPECAPGGPKRCLLCGAKYPAVIEVMHLNGNESDLGKHNLAWGCRSCNTRLGKLFSKVGIGTKTRQYNPAGGAKSLGAWLSAIQIVKYGAPGGVNEALATIRDTPAGRRKEFSAAAWAARRKVYGKTGRSDAGEIPF
jgi:hypothetical protein